MPYKSFSALAGKRKNGIYADKAALSRLSYLNKNLKKKLKAFLFFANKSSERQRSDRREERLTEKSWQASEP